MPVYIEREEQPNVDRLRNTLAEATLALSEVQTHDSANQRKKTATMQHLADIRQTMDALGLVHSMMKGQRHAAS